MFTHWKNWDTLQLAAQADRMAGELNTDSISTVQILSCVVTMTTLEDDIF